MDKLNADFLSLNSDMTAQGYGTATSAKGSSGLTLGWENMYYGAPGKTGVWDGVTGAPWGWQASFYNTHRSGAGGLSVEGLVAALQAFEKKGILFYDAFKSEGGKTTGARPGSHTLAGIDYGTIAIGVAALVGLYLFTKKQPINGKANGKV